MEANTDEVMDGYDSFTGLHLFMVAAMGSCHDLSAIYGMMKMSPEMNTARTKAPSFYMHE